MSNYNKTEINQKNLQRNPRTKKYPTSNKTRIKTVMDFDGCDNQVLEIREKKSIKIDKNNTYQLNIDRNNNSKKYIK